MRETNDKESTMKGLTFKLNYTRAEAEPTAFGWDEIEILDQRLSRTEKRAHPEGHEVTAYCYEYIALCDGEISILDSEEFDEEVAGGVYGLRALG
jgi:hypothetical protein